MSEYITLVIKLKLKVSPKSTAEKAIKNFETTVVPNAQKDQPKIMMEICNKVFAPLAETIEIHMEEPCANLPVRLSSGTPV